MINALGMNPDLYLQPNAMRTNQVTADKTHNFDDVFSSSMNKNDVMSRLRSIGVPIQIKDTPKESKSLGPNGVTIAPNIIRKMEQDEEYAQEIIDEILGFLDYMSDCERDYALQGAKLKWIGMSIDSDGKVVMWAGGVPIEDPKENGEDDEALIVTRGGKKANNQTVDYDTLIKPPATNVDASTFLALVGNVNLKPQHKDD